MMTELRRATGAAAADSDDGGRWTNFYRSALIGVLGIGFAIVAWEGERVITRLDNIETAQNSMTKVAAVQESRLQALESDKTQQWELLNGHEHRITVLESSKKR